MSTTSINIASHIPAMAKLSPERAAIIAPDGNGWKTLTFAQLDAQSDVYARGLEAIGIKRGVRTVLLVPPSLDFFPLVFALFKVGAVIVMIDPGIGRKAMLKCLAEIDAEAFIGIPAAHVARLLFPGPFRKVKSLVTVGPRLFWGGHSLENLKSLGGSEKYDMAVPSPHETAAILFTSGSTGIPKGVVYTHEIFDAQVRMIRDTYDIRPGEIDLPTFPLFALFDPALGMTAVLPKMDFRSPAKADPKLLIQAIETHQCTSMFGSPALLNNLGLYGVAHHVKLPTIKRVLSAGAPVRVDILKDMSQLLNADAQIFTPFGATESLPVSSIGSHEVLNDTSRQTSLGAGVCVGKPVNGTTVSIIRISDEPIDTWSDDLLVPQGTIGEIAVRGAVVTREYYGRPVQTRLAKIKDGIDVIHRMGDVGYLDAHGRLWMCGRKSHRVVTATETLFTTPIEEILNQCPGVKRTALVGIPDGSPDSKFQHPVLLIERVPHSNSTNTDFTKLDGAEFLKHVRAFSTGFPLTKKLSDFRVYQGSFPVDARHNAKIEREKLSVWAASDSMALAAR